MSKPRSLRTVLSSLIFIPRALALVWKASRAWTAGWFVLLVLQSGIPVAVVYLGREIVNVLVRAPEIVSGGRWESLVAPFALMAGVLLVQQALGGLSSWVGAMQSELVQDYVTTIVHDQALALDLSYYDDPVYHDRLHRARVDAVSKPIALLSSLGSLLQSGLTLVAMAGVLLPFGFWMPAALVLGTLPAVYVTALFTWRLNEWRLKTTTDQRRLRYLDWMITLRDAAAELRLFAIGGFFRDAYRILRKRLRGEQLGLMRRQIIAGFGAGIFAMVVSWGAVGLIVYRAALGRVSLGDLALFYQAFNRGQGLLHSLLQNAGQIFANSLFLENLFEFLSLKPRLADPLLPKPVPADPRSGLRFENVTFRYPGNDRPSLSGFSLDLPAGRTTAIVGPNGAGKTTLIKMLCRFYDPEAGRVLYDGTDIRDFLQEEYRRRVTVLFQEPVRYSETVVRNIAYSDLAANPRLGRIVKAAREAGADEPTSRLPKGYRSRLGKWLGGAELSVGEWQRIALARAFLREAPVIILDEPTSAMDSWAETDWLARFRRLARGRTAVVVTHRFTTAMQADIIHVMDKGRIVESGTHPELLEAGGIYARSWKAQMAGRDGRAE